MWGSLLVLRTTCDSQTVDWKDLQGCVVCGVRGYIVWGVQGSVIGKLHWYEGPAPNPLHPPHPGGDAQTLEWTVCLVYRPTAAHLDSIQDCWGVSSQCLCGEAAALLNIALLRENTVLVLYTLHQQRNVLEPELLKSRMLVPPPT